MNGLPPFVEILAEWQCLRCGQITKEKRFTLPVTDDDPIPYGLMEPDCEPCRNRGEDIHRKDNPTQHLTIYAEGLS